jgi:hypothetical protein
VFGTRNIATENAGSHACKISLSPESESGEVRWESVTNLELFMNTVVN